MTKPTVLLALASIVSSCSHQTADHSSIPLGRYAELAGQETKSAKKYRLTMSFTGKDEVLTAPSLVARPGKEVKVEMLREFVYPDDFKPAETSKLKMAAAMTSGVYPVTPTTPTKFEKRNLGYVGTFTVEPRGAFVIIKGMLSHEKFAGFSRAPGEAISPIVDAKTKLVFSDNRVDLPNFVRSETPVYIAGLPGVPHKIDLPAIPGSVTITCEPIH